MLHYTARQLWDKSRELEMPLAEFNCTCLDEPNYYIGDSGYCWFCELIDKLNAEESKCCTVTQS